MNLRGTPLEVGRELGCLADNIDAARQSGRVEDLGHPSERNPLIKDPEADALLYRCQGEHCQRVDDGEIFTLCSFGIYRVLNADGTREQHEYEWPDESFTQVITSSHANMRPLCANRRQNPPPDL